MQQLDTDRQITFVRYRTNEKMQELSLTPSLKHGGGSIIIWGRALEVGKWEIFRFEGAFSKEKYHKIL